MPTISKNILWSAATSTLQVYTGSIVFIVLAKLMSVESFGILSFGFSLATIIVVCADFGLSLMIMKDYPNVFLEHKKYVSNSLLVKVSFSAIVCFVAATYLHLLYAEKWVLIGFIFVLFAIVSSFTVFLQALLKVKNKFNQYTETSIVYAASITITILIYWLTEVSLASLALAFLFCKMLQFFWSLYLCRESFAIDTLSLNYQKNLVLNSWSYGAHTVLGIFYFMLDTQIISIYLGAKQVALYQAVFRVILGLLIISELLSNVLLPYLSFKYAKKEVIDQLVSKLFLYLFVVGCSLFLFFNAFGEFIIRFLYSEEYLEALPIVLPLSIVIVFRTVSSLLGNILTISNKQVYTIITVFVSLTFSILFNFIFIPFYGIIGAAWVSAFVHFSMFIMYLLYSKKEVKQAKFISSDIIIVLLSVTSLFFTIQWFLNLGTNIFISLAMTAWIACIVFIMKRNKNFTFLSKLLKDKGL